MRRKIRVAAIAAVAAALTAEAGAFGESGHRVIGRLAELHLGGARAPQEVRKILRPKETLADASVWPDTIRAVTYEDEETGPFRLKHPAHDVYHYTNLPFQAVRYHAAVPGARPTDIVQMTRECIRVLRGTSDLFTAREALRLLAHLIGDMHQPLHVGTGYIAAEGPLRFIVPEGATGWRMALGGNALRYGPQDNFNLHSYWDTHAVNLVMQKEDFRTYAGRLRDQLPPSAKWNNEGDVESWPEQWANEALALARDAHHRIPITSYLGPDEARRTAHRWRIQQPAGYDDLARRHIPTQLAKAGYRLAATLRAIWPD